jgi:glycosyltransferase involved in cell wall biosynthesis
MDAMHALAIVIPAYKPTFLRAALDSIAAQTDTRFRVYVGDDAAPAEVAEICASYGDGRVDLVYHRYDENLGRTSLTAHWNRCVRLSTEPWIWLFADDDVMEPACVARLYRELEGSAPSDLLRFDTTVIGARGDVLSENPPHPPVESGVDFIHARLIGERNSYVVEYVFRRDAFERAGGFPSYPVAWCADDAAWYLFSKGGRIRTLQGPRVLWRASGLNITDAKRANQREKLTAAAMFLRFVEEEIRPSDASGRSEAEWRDAEERWYRGQVQYLLPIRPSLWGDVIRGSADIWRVPRWQKVMKLSLGGMGGWARQLRTSLTRRIGAALGLGRS